MYSVAIPGKRASKASSFPAVKFSKETIRSRIPNSESIRAPRLRETEAINLAYLWAEAEAGAVFAEGIGEFTGGFITRGPQGASAHEPACSHSSRGQRVLGFRTTCVGASDVVFLRPPDLAELISSPLVPVGGFSFSTFGRGGFSAASLASLCAFSLALFASAAWPAARCSPQTFSPSSAAAVSF